MKVIDLVEQIALKNIPKRIKYNDYEWEYDGENYKIQASSGTYMNWDYIIFNCLNDEVEIIEPQEHKIPEKLKCKAKFQYSEIPTWLEKKEIINAMNENFEKHQKAIYEILDYLEGQIER